MGRAPNIAARLQVLAAPDAIVVSEATHRLLHGVFAATSLGRHQLAGIDETIEVFQIESEQPVATVVTLDARAGCGAAGQPGGRIRLPRALLGAGPGRTWHGDPAVRRGGHRQVAARQGACLRFAGHGASGPVVSELALFRRQPAASGHRAYRARCRDHSRGQRRAPPRRLERLVGSLRAKLPDLVEILADLLGVEQSRYSSRQRWRRPRSAFAPWRISPTTCSASPGSGQRS